MHFSTTPTGLTVYRLLADGDSDWCELIPLYGLNLHVCHILLKLTFKACPFYFSNCDYSLVLQSVFLKHVPHFEMFWPLPPSRHFEGRFHFQPCSTCSYEVTISTGFKAAFAGNCQRAAAFLCSPPW